MTEFRDCLGTVNSHFIGMCVYEIGSEKRSG